MRDDANRSQERVPGAIRGHVGDAGGGFLPASLRGPRAPLGPDAEAAIRQLGEVLRHAPQWPPPLQAPEVSRAKKNRRQKALRAERKAANK